jgi:hypothetical protein
MTTAAVIYAFWLIVIPPSGMDYIYPEYTEHTYKTYNSCINAMNVVIETHRLDGDFVQFAKCYIKENK